MANAPISQPSDGKILEGKRVLITGGTGSLGKVLLRRILGGDAGQPTQIIVLSRDEAKQHQIRVEYQQRYAATDEARIAQADRPRFVDHAWKTIVDLLRPRQAAAREAIA